ncbi:MAG: HD-GYP domain-containing protein [Chitinispirillaceae bacterium]|nr:HD-GYP domain-containing protein [Chitinispirillaceae bacterium]
MMEQKRKISTRIPIEEVKVGMILSDVLNKEEQILFSLITITNQEDIERLKRLGAVWGYIYNHREKEEVENKKISEEKDDREKITEREKLYYEELERAKEIHQRTLEAVKSTLHDVRMGKQVNVKKIEEAAEEMVASIVRNPDALVSLAQIKGYDDYTYEHSVNVGILITSLVYSMGYPKDLLFEAGIGGILHDIGKMTIPEHILNKPGSFTPEEYAIMKRHPENGLRILKKTENISEFSKIVVIEHHERYNGSGYPRGIKEREIHEIGLVAAVVDVYDAMTTDRVYRAAWPPPKALALIFKGANVDFSPRIVNLFTKNLGIYPVGSFVRLASGEMGIVIKVDRGSFFSPDILVLFDDKGERLKEPVEYRLSELQKREDGEKYKIEMALNSKNFGIKISDYLEKNPFA